MRENSDSSMKSSSAFQHLGLAGKVAVERRLGHADRLGQLRRGDALAAALGEHARQGFKNRLAALAAFTAWHK